MLEVFLRESPEKVGKDSIAQYGERIIAPSLLDFVLRLQNDRELSTLVKLPVQHYFLSRGDEVGEKRVRY
jgi:hypothetical protein